MVRSLLWPNQVLHGRVRKVHLCHSRLWLWPSLMQRYTAQLRPATLVEITIAENVGSRFLRC
ncbi:hypothetical protein GBA52_018122 [Prunus armeniaca]|nr:hypothetical protein GBA52_018122 [Prunus armeniaca]